jgi:hypothetical protein
MTDDDLPARSAADASLLQSRILAAAEITDEAGGGRVAARALGNALVGVVQEYLERTSNEDDVELFFEVHGREPADLGAWPANILADLSRHEIPPDSQNGIRESAVQTAVRYVRSSSPLAWGER